jgi:protease-4
MAKQETRPRIIWGLLILFFLFLISSCVAMIISLGDLDKDRTFEAGNVAVIPIKGVITTEQASSFFAEDIASSDDIVQQIEDVKANKKIKAIIFEINSPGGSPVASEEIGNAIKELQMPTVAYIRETGASGAYWIATATDHIVAQRMSVTGSIGVYGSYLEFPGLLTRFNITYRRLVSGKYKDAGVPYRALEEDEEALIQGKLDIIHSYFIEEVANNRNLSINDTIELATGMFYLGSEAKDLGLIDEIGDKSTAVKYIEGRIGEKASLITYERGHTFWDVVSDFSAKNSYHLGKGISSIVKEDFKITT